MNDKMSVPMGNCPECGCSDRDWWIEWCTKTQVVIGFKCIRCDYGWRQVFVFDYAEPVHRFTRK